MRMKFLSENLKVREHYEDLCVSWEDNIKTNIIGVEREKVVWIQYRDHSENGNEVLLPLKQGIHWPAE
jgi:hypothetical protein